MGNSLQDQLLKAGVANKQKASKINAEKRKKNRQQRQSSTGNIDPDKLAVQEAQQEKATKDRQLNAERQQQARQKEIIAQIRQLIEMNRLPQDKEGIAYNFADQNLVKTIYLSEKLRDQVSNGRLAIVKLGAGYEVVPSIVANKIFERDPSTVVVLNEQQESASDDEDPYAEYEIPDDLMW